MSLLNKGRHSRTPLSAEKTFCGERCFFESDNRRYDALFDEGYMEHQVKLMCGQADPPAPDDE